MFQRLALSILTIGLTLSFSAETVNLKGKVTNKDGNAIKDAIVTLVGQAMKDTTGADGMYEIKTPEVGVVRQLQPEAKNFIIDKGSLVFSLPESTPLAIDMFDIKGNLVKRVANPDVSSGFYRFNISENGLAARVLIIRVAIGKDTKTFRYLPLQNGSYMLNQIAQDHGSHMQTAGLMKIAAINDTLKITATGYTAKSVAIVSYEQQMDIALEAEGNGSTESSGCGKNLGSVNKSGTYQISTVQGRGTYIIDIPTDYNKDTPYRLIFGMHCMNGTAQRVAANDNGDDLSAFYSMKTQAEKDNVKCIYVAPSGNANGTWNPGSDAQFFKDLLTMLKNDFCIDTSRVFVCGFSFGAMYSYALSLEFPEQIRAVACYAPANWNFDPQPTNRHIPIAYYQTTGTGDNLCGWINNDANKKGGKYCVLQHAEDNGCDANQEIKLATSGTHVTTEFKGCKEGYPVKFSSFNGQHQCMASDQGSSDNWIEVETWKFFKQF